MLLNSYYKRVVVGVLAVCLVVIDIGSPAVAYAADEELTLEQIAELDAAKFYVSKQYQQSLLAFKELENEHPTNVIIKRYVAKLYDILRQRDKAIRKLKELLSINSDDLIGRQMLADIYVKQAQFVEALDQYEELEKRDDTGRFAPYAKSRIEEIGNIMDKSGDAGELRIPIQDFMKTDAAKSFTRGQYKEALIGLNELLETYPEDVLLYRMKGIAQFRLDQFQDAKKSLEKGLEIEPENVALQFYLGQVLTAMGETQEARQAFQWVIANDKGDYGRRAQQSIFLTLRRAQTKRKPWSINLINGFEFDTNATYKSNVSEVRVAGDKNSAKFTTTATGSYRFFSRRKFSATADALYAHTLHADFPQLNTYTFGGGISGLFVFNFLKKPAYLSVRNGQTVTLLQDKFFVFSNTLSTRVIMIPTKKTRTMVGHRFVYSQYDSSGSAPELTDRDGFANIASVDQTFYFNEAKTFSLSMGYFYERHEPRGQNFIKNVHGGSLGLKFPIFFKVTGDINFRFKDSNYKKFGSTPPKRRDDTFTLTTSLMRPIGDKWTFTTRYIFEDNRGKNTLYDYTKHRFGVQLGYKL